MPSLTDTELRMVTEIVFEMAKSRGRSFDKKATGATLARAALIDPDFRARLADVHRQIEARRTMSLPRRMLASISFRHLELEAEAVLSGGRKPE
jgi:hypothetical protein